MQVLAGQPTQVCPCVGVHRWTSLTSSSLFLPHCATCLVHLTWMVCEIAGKWIYSCCLVGSWICSKQYAVSWCISHLAFSPDTLLKSKWCCHTDTARAWKNSSFTLSKRLNFHMISNLSIVVYAFPTHTLTSLSINEILLLRYGNEFIDFRSLPFSVDMAPSS